MQICNDFFLPQIYIIQFILNDETKLNKRHIRDLRWDLSKNGNYELSL